MTLASELFKSVPTIDSKGKHVSIAVGDFVVLRDLEDIKDEQFMANYNQIKEKLEGDVSGPPYEINQIFTPLENPATIHFLFKKENGKYLPFPFSYFVKDSINKN